MLFTNLFTDLLKCQTLRLERLKTRCAALNITALESLSEESLKNLTDTFISDEEHRVILKTVPKCGSTSWKTILINNSATAINKHKVLQNPHKRYLTSRIMPFLYSYNKSVIIRRIRDYFSILTVRHPLNRLESAFNNSWYKGRVSTVANYSSEEEQAMYFSKVIHSLLGVRYSKVDPHYRNITEHAHPCLFPFR